MNALTLVFTLGLFFVPTALPGLKEAAARPAARTGAVFWILLWPLALLGAFPSIEASLWHELSQTLFAARVTEVGASGPLALVDGKGEALAVAAFAVPAGHTPLLYLIRTTLVAAIAGGVTLVIFWILAASFYGRKLGAGTLAGLAALTQEKGALAWRGAAIYASLAWLILSWTLANWPYRHVLGTDALGRDVLAQLPAFWAAGLSLAGWCALVVGLFFAARGRGFKAGAAKGFTKTLPAAALLSGAAAAMTFFVGATSGTVAVLAAGWVAALLAGVAAARG